MNILQMSTESSVQVAFILPLAQHLRKQGHLVALACSDDPGEAGRSFVEPLRQQGFEVQVLRTEVMPKFIGKIFTFPNDSYHSDIGTPESLQTAEREYPWHPAA